MDLKKLLKSIGMGILFAFLGYLLSGSSLSWLLGLLIIYLELRGRKK